VTPKLAEQTSALDDLVDRVKAARLLSVSPRTLDRWHLLRQGPPRIRYGAQVRYRRTAIAEWLLRHEQGELDSRLYS
jgi:hypothetical protein